MKRNINASVKSMAVILIALNAFVYICSSLYVPFLGAYYSEEGINASQIGILLAIGPIIAILIQPLWARLSDYTGRRREILMLVTFGCALAILTYYLGNNFMGYFFVTILLSAFSTSILPLCDAIVVDRASKINFNFAYVRLGGTLGYALTVSLAGHILKARPAAAFIMASGSYLIMTCIISRLPKEHKAKPHMDMPHRLQKSKTKIFKDKEIIFVLLFAFICQVGLCFCTGFMGVYLLKLGYNQSDIGTMNTISALSEVPILLCIRKLLKKFGTMKILAFSGIVTSMRIFMVTGETLTNFVLSQLMQSMSYMTTYYCCVTYISEHVAPEHRSRGQGMLAIVQAGLGSIGGMMLGGRVIDLIGMHNSYILMGSMVLSISVLIILAYFIFINKSLIRAKIFKNG